MIGAYSFPGDVKGSVVGRPTRRLVWVPTPKAMLGLGKG